MLGTGSTGGEERMRGTEKIREEERRRTQCQKATQCQYHPRLLVIFFAPGSLGISEVVAHLVFVSFYSNFGSSSLPIKP
jgi:hypothetical protein